MAFLKYQGKPCFINFTKKLLEFDLPTYFDPSEIVIEVLENVVPNPKLITICQRLNSLGYTLALDDFVFHESDPYILELLKHVNILKVDFQNTSQQMRRKIEKLAKSQHLHLLAEKVETRNEFEEAKKYEYVYFQSYFFSKPVIFSSYDVPTYVHIYFNIVQKLSEKEPNIQAIALIERDLSLSYQLLKLINSSALRPKYKFTRSYKRSLI